MNTENEGEAGGENPSMETSSFRSAVGWSFALSGGRQGFGFLITLVLAALLGPVAFGTVAMATVFISFTQVVLVQGLMPALIQRRELTKNDLSSIFWFSLAASFVLAAVCILLSGWWAEVNRLDDLQPVIIALSILVPVSGLTVVQEAWLRRHLQFKKLAIRDNASVVIGGVAGIAAALMGAGVWSLVFQQIVTQTIAVTVLWRVSDWRPSKHLAWQEVRSFMPFTGASTLSAAGSMVNNQGDALIIGLFFGPEVVGLYRLGSRVVSAVVEVLARSLQAVSLPELSRLHRDPVAVRNRLESLLSLAARTSIPPLAVLAAVAPWFVPMIGAEWEPATGALVILSVVGAMRVFCTFSGPLLQALNRPYLLSVLVWVGAGLSGLFYVLAGILLEEASVARQVSGMALASFLLFIVLVAINSWILQSFGGLRVGDQVRVMRVPVLAGTLSMIVGLSLFVSGITEGLRPILGVLLVGTLAVGVGAATLLLLDAPTREALGGAKRAFLRRRTRDR